MPRKIPAALGQAALAESKNALARSEPPARQSLATAVRYLLQELAERAPGQSVEVRVPPFGAVQVIDGPRHTRGTPPNVIEMDAPTWLALGTGELSWAEALTHGRISRSGARADLTGLLPLQP